MYLTTVAVRHPSPIYRNLAIPLATFDHLKAFQRHLNATTGRSYTLMEVISTMAQEHQQQELQRVGDSA